MTGVEDLREDLRSQRKFYFLLNNHTRMRREWSLLSTPDELGVREPMFHFLEFSLTISFFSLINGIN